MFNRRAEIKKLEEESDELKGHLPAFMGEGEYRPIRWEGFGGLRTTTSYG